MRQRSMTIKMTWIRPPTPGLLVILDAEVARWSRRGHFEFQYDPTAFRLKRLPIARMFGSLVFARTQSIKPRIRTMSFTMSLASLPVFDISLNALSSILDKAEAHAAAKTIDSSVLLHSRLSPDMFALVRQVQIATDHAKNGSARLAGLEAPSYEDNETTMNELKTRIARTVAYLKTLELQADQFVSRSGNLLSARPDQHRPYERRRLPKPFCATELRTS